MRICDLPHDTGFISQNEMKDFISRTYVDAFAETALQELLLTGGIKITFPRRI